MISKTNIEKTFRHSKKALLIYKQNPLLIVGVIVAVLFLIFSTTLSRKELPPTPIIGTDQAISISPKKDEGIFGKINLFKSNIFIKSTNSISPTSSPVDNASNQNNQNQQSGNQDTKPPTSSRGSTGTNSNPSPTSQTPNYENPTNTPVKIVPTTVILPTAIPVVPSPTPLPAPTAIVSRMYVDVYMHSGNSDFPYQGAKIKFVNKDTGAILGIVYTGSSGRSAEVTAPASTNVDVFAYPSGSPNTTLCGSSRSFNTGPYGTMQASTLRIFTSGQNPCIHE